LCDCHYDKGESTEEQRAPIRRHSNHKKAERHSIIIRKHRDIQNIITRRRHSIIIRKHREYNNQNAVMNKGKHQKAVLNKERLLITTSRQQ
jgi:hypothetical protein